MDALNQLLNVLPLAVLRGGIVPASHQTPYNRSTCWKKRTKEMKGLLLRWSSQ